MLRPSLSPLVRSALIALAPLVGILPSAQAATFKVTNLNDSGAGSFRAAMLSANGARDADTIDATGVRGTVNLLTPLPRIEGVLTIAGSGGYDFSLRRSSSQPFNIFTVNGGSKVTISNMSMVGGGGGLETGGGIDNEGTLCLNNCVVTSNNARRGGGIFSTGSLTLKGCTISSNVADGGGAISSSNGFLTATDTTFFNNASSGDGGALVLLHTSTSLKRCTFANNKAGARENTSDNPGWGGAIFALAHFDLSGAGLTIENCTLAGNKAGRGGALYTSGQRTEIKNATVCDNTALGGGAGIWSEGNTTTLTFVGGTILAGNSTSPTALGTDAEIGAAKNTFTSLGYNLIGGGNATTKFSQKSDKTGLTREQLMLGTLGSNGGLTETLLPRSFGPAINAIPPTALLVNTDQRGKTRPLGGCGDIGAVEAEDVSSGSTFVVNTPATAGDGSCTPSNCTLREALDTVNMLSPTNGWTKTYTITFDPKVFSTPQSIFTGQPSADQNFRSGFVATGNMKIIGPGANLLRIAPGTGSFIGGPVQISGVTFSGGAARYYFGGAFVNTGNLELTDCIISDNAAEAAAAGGILNLGTLSLLRCTVSNNLTRSFGASPKTYSGGGGIYNQGIVTIKDSLISNNSAPIGGGIYNTGTVTIENSSISSNKSDLAGGIFNNSSGVLTILGSTINENTGVNPNRGLTAGYLF